MNFNIHSLLADCVESLLILGCVIVVWAYRKMYDWYWVIHCPVLTFCFRGKIYNQKLQKKESGGEMAGENARGMKAVPASLSLMCLGSGVGAFCPLVEK